MHMGNIVKVDVDGVIRDMLGALCKLYFAFDPNIDRNDVTDYSVNNSFPLIREDVGVDAHDYFFKYHVEDVNFNMAVPFPGAKTALEKLRNAGYKVVIVTKQNSYLSKLNTLKFLTHYRIPYDDISFTGDKWLVKSDFMIDDNPEFLNDERESTPQAKRLLIDAPYNKKCHNFERFSTLMDAVNYINDLSLVAIDK